MKTVLLLGALSDMAVAAAHQFAAKGYSIQLAARRKERLDPLIRDIGLRYQVPVVALEFDVCNTASHAEFLTRLPARPDVVVCAVGLLGDAAEARVSGALAQDILAVNFNGPVSILDLVAHEMEARRSGAIIGISSVAGERGRQSNYHYGSAKAGFTAYLSGLRNRLHHAGVRVITIKPGFVRTRMTEGLKLPPVVTAGPDEVARAIVQSLETKQDVMYIRWIWRWIMCLIRAIPESVFKRMKM